MTTEQKYQRWATWREKGGKPPRPKGLPTKIPKTWWARYLKEHPPAPKPLQPTALHGYVRAATSCTPDHPEGRAFRQAGGTHIFLQHRDPATDAANRQEEQRWRAQWNALGIRAGTWWRVNHWPTDEPPAGSTLDVPNPEDPAELARIFDLLKHRPYGLFVLGKTPGVPVDLLNDTYTRLVVEAFKENEQSDTTVEECIRFWRKAGLRDDLLVVALDAAAPVFAPLAVQAEQAIQLGIRQLAVYPLDGADPAGLQAIGALLK